MIITCEGLRGMIGAQVGGVPGYLQFSEAALQGVEALELSSGLGLVQPRNLSGKVMS